MAIQREVSPLAMSLSPRCLLHRQPGFPASTTGFTLIQHLNNSSVLLLSKICLEMELFGHDAHRFVTQIDLTQLPSMGVVPIYAHLSCVRVSLSTRPCEHIVFPNLLFFTNLKGEKCLQLVLVCIHCYQVQQKLLRNSYTTVFY